MKRVLRCLACLVAAPVLVVALAVFALAWVIALPLSITGYALTGEWEWPHTLMANH